MINIKKHLYIMYIYIILNISNIFAATPGIIHEVEDNLPWSNASINNVAQQIWWWLITTMIKYVAIIAVIALMLSWIMYLISGWEEEKVKKAKNWIIWSLIWVLLSISAMWIIELINKLHLNN